MKYVEILLVVGKKCNFRCSYCYTQHKEDAYIDQGNILSENIDKVFKHIDWYLSKVETMRITFYGGEPLCYPDFIRQIVSRYRENPNIDFNLVTNGVLLQKYWDIFEGIPKNRMFFAVSYDYSLQDTQRHEGTYQVVRDAVKFLVQKGCRFKTITVFTNETLPRIKEVFEDHLKLERECGREFIGRVNTAKSTFKDAESVYTDSKLLEDLQYIQRYNKEHPRGGWRTNACMLNRKNEYAYLNFLPECYAICPDGRITWDCRSWFYNDSIDSLTTGTIFEEPEIVYENRQKILKEWGGHISEECKNCETTACKITPFRFHENESPVHWGEPPTNAFKYHCKITRFMAKYLNG